MKNNFEEALRKVLAHEGGYVNHPKDPGGMTNLGVTRRVWEKWTRKPATEADMKALTPAMVAPLYRAQYWDAVRGDDLPGGVDYALFDAAVNSGPRQAVKWLQRAVGATDDGKMGPATLAAVQAQAAATVVGKFSDQRLAFLKSLETFAVFGKGWSRRVADVSGTAHHMAGTTTTA
jgi:lysozyme family protein